MKSLFAVIDNTTLRFKLIFLSTVSFVLVALITLIAYRGISMLSGTVGEQVASSTELRALMMGDMMHDGTKGNVLNALYTAEKKPDMAMQKEIIEKFEDDRKTMMQSIATLEKASLGTEAGEALKRVKPDVELYLSLASGIVNSAFSDHAGAAARLPGFLQQFVVLEKSMGDLGDAIEKDIASAADHAEQAGSDAFRQLLIAAAVGIVFSLVLSVVIFRSIIRQLGGDPVHAADMARRIAAGDLTIHVDTAPGDTTSLLYAMRLMAEDLTEVVRTIKDAAGGISVGTSEIAAGNADLSSRTEQQASSLEETASAMEQLTSTVRTNADNAKQASQLAAGASAVAVDGGEVVRQVVDTMSGISESSKKIADIIGVIDGIAFQTNILALNAAVEAARAGEQGRGFAVVASEVRNLAQRSAAAAKEIKELITDSTSRVDAGTVLVDKAGKTMDEVVTSIKRVTDIMSEISSASQEQSTGIDQVSTAISQMDQVTQQNAALVEQAAAAAESLEEQAQRLVHAVDIFRLDNSGGEASTNNAAPVVALKRTPGPPAKIQKKQLQTSRRGVSGTKAAEAAAEAWEEF